MLHQPVCAPGDDLLGDLLGEVHDRDERARQFEFAVGVDEHEALGGFDEAAPGDGEGELAGDRGAADAGEVGLVVDGPGDDELLAGLPAQYTG